MSIPRNFKLLEEIDNESNYAGISYGLKSADDIELKDFTGMIIDSKGNMSTFEINCPNEYPNIPPTVKIIKTGNQKVYDLFSNSLLKDSNKPIKEWKESSTMADILLYIQKIAQ